MQSAAFGRAALLAFLAFASSGAKAANITAIAIGGAHSCALNDAGGVKCWGYNFYGDLGDGTTGNSRPTPADVVGLTSGVTAIAAGVDHTCAVTTAGTVLCWGYNAFGQLGDGTMNNRSTPTLVPRLAHVVDITAGAYHTCALTSGGGVKCWGWNLSGQLGDGTQSQRNVPGFVRRLKSGVVAIAAGGNHTCAMTETSGLKCWGDNGDGEVGDGTTTDRLAPVSIFNRGIVDVVAGQYHTCVVNAKGGVACWGLNDHGQLGDGTMANHASPTFVTGLKTGYAGLGAGWYHTCAVAESGAVKCWGNNQRGELGDGTTTNRLAPTAVSGLASGIAALAGGQDHTCARTTAGGVKCWGWNVFGQVGDGTDENKLTPVDVGGL